MKFDLSNQLPMRWNLVAGGVDQKLYTSAIGEKKKKIQNVSLRNETKKKEKKNEGKRKEGDGESRTIDGR